MKISPEKFTANYKLNPSSVRDFEKFVIIQNNKGELICQNSTCQEFLETLMIDGRLSITEKVLADDSGIILDGNIRYAIVSQVLHNYPDITIDDIEVERVIYTPEKAYLTQLKNSAVPLTLRQKIKALNNFRAADKQAYEKIEKHLGLKYKRYFNLIDRYMRLPEWLKTEGDIYDVSLNALIEFNDQPITDKEKAWEKIKQYALKDSVTKFVISSKHVQMLENSKGCSSAFEVAVNDTGVSAEDVSEADINEFSNADYDRFIINILSKLKTEFETFNPEKWYNEYRQVCQNKEKFLREIDKLLHIIESL